MLTTIEDFARYMAFQAAAWPARPITKADPDNGPVRRSSVREMQQPWTFNSLVPSYHYLSGRVGPLVNSYGYGLRIARDDRGRRYVGHSGGLPGFGSHWWLLPDYNVGVVAFTNQTYAVPVPASFAALDTLVALAGLQPRPVPVSAILAQRKAELTQLLPAWNTTATNPIFAENFFLDESLASRRQATQALFADIGKVLSVSELQPENQLRGRFQLVGERGTVDVFFTLSPEAEARIQQLDVERLPAKK